jgi:hypothetical protein
VAVAAAPSLSHDSASGLNLKKTTIYHVYLQCQLADGACFVVLLSRDFKIWWFGVRFFAFSE